MTLCVIDWHNDQVLQVQGDGEGLSADSLPKATWGYPTGGFAQATHAELVEDACGPQGAPPANRLEALKGKRKGRYNIRINDRWRISFRWEGGDAHDVEIVDYH